MKTSFFKYLIVTLAVIASAPRLVATPQGSITLDHIDGLVSPGQINVGPVTLYLRMTVSSGGTGIQGLSNGFRVYSPDAATWSGLTADTLNNVFASFAMAKVINYYSADGAGADTIGFMASSIFNSLSPGYDQTAFSISFTTNAGDVGKNICIDSSYFPPSGIWKWVSQDMSTGFPTWDGPHCYQVVGQPPVSFTVAPTSDTADVFYIRQADLDMDNNSDVVYTGTTSDSLCVIYGKADGSLEKPRAYYKIKKAELAVDYIDRDTLLDIIARTTDKIYILLNQGNRNFGIDSMAISSSMLERSPASTSFPSVATGFFNGDANKDIVASQSTILFGNGSGGIASTTTIPFAFDAVASGDFNDDGHDDLVATIGDSAKIFLNDGSGAMTRSSAVPIGSHVFDVSGVTAGVDFDKDGKIDFVTVLGQSVPGSHDTSLVTVVLGNGAGGVQSRDSIRVLGSAVNLAVNDVNRDGQLDISLINAGTRSLSIFEGNGSGSFPVSSSVSLGAGTEVLQAIVTADLNRDGNPDYLTGGGTAPVVLATSEILPLPVLPAEMVVTGYGGINFCIENPRGDKVSRYLRTVAGSSYWRTDINSDGRVDARSFDYNLLAGEYRIVIRIEPYLPPDNSFTCDIRFDGAQQVKMTNSYSLQPPGMSAAQAEDSMIIYYTVEATPSMNPPNGERTRTRQPVFMWQKLVDTVGSTRYQIQVSRRYDFSSTVLNDSTLAVPRYAMPTALDIDSVYYWRARSGTGVGWSTWTRTMAAYIGEGCCVGYTGNLNMSGVVDLADLSALVSYLTGGGYVLPCGDEANVNASSIIDLADLSALVSYLTGGGYALPPCR